MAPLLSEWGLMRHRVEVEVLYLVALADWGVPELAGLTAAHRLEMAGWVADFGDADVARIKALEQTTNHDVKAVEYWLKERMEGAGMGAWSEFVHFGLTSQDVNNTAVPLSLKRATVEVLRPRLAAVRDGIAAGAVRWKGVPMLARTHGQPASPVTMGKEWAVFVERLDAQLAQLDGVVYAAKFGGATGGSMRTGWLIRTWIGRGSRTTLWVPGWACTAAGSRPRSNTTTTWRLGAMCCGESM